MATIEEDAKMNEPQDGNTNAPRSTKTRCIVIALLIFIALAIIIALAVFFTNERNSNEEKSEVPSFLRQQTSLVGRNIELSCPLEDQKTAISWYFNDKPVSLGKRISISDGLLSIREITPNDGGEYTCGADNKKSYSIILAVVEVLLNNVTSQTGEGPHWEQDTQSLFFVDNFAHQLHRWNSVTGQHDIETFDGNVGFVVPYENGGYIVSVERSLIHFDWETKKIKKLHEVDFGTFNIINDGKVDPKGRVWTGTLGNFTDLRDPIFFHKGSMYMMDLDGSLHKKWENVSISNGFAWSRDNKTMYYVDSIPRKVYKFQYDVDTGEIEYQGVAIDFENANEDFHVLGYPDGVAMDTEGMIWIACYEAAKVVRFNPKTGERLRIIDFKGIARRTTSCCFGGPNHDILYVTCGGAQTTEEIIEDQYHGSVFRVTGLGVQGYPGRKYKGVI